MRLLLHLIHLRLNHHQFLLSRTHPSKSAFFYFLISHALSPTCALSRTQAARAQHILADDGFQLHPRACEVCTRTLGCLGTASIAYVRQIHPPLAPYLSTKSQQTNQKANSLFSYRLSRTPQPSGPGLVSAHSLHRVRCKSDDKLIWGV